MTLLIVSTQSKLTTVERVCLRIDARVSDVRHCNENLERVLFIWFPYASLDFAFNFCFPLLTVTGVGDNILHQLDEVRGDEGEPAHLLKPSSFLKHQSTDGRADTRACESR
jgi:hypothetical protein